MSPETQTLVSTTTRSGGPANLANGVHHVSFDLGWIELTVSSDLRAAIEEGIEALLPLLYGDLASPLGFEPGIDGRADEFGYRASALVGETAEKVELAFVQIDVRAAHLSYIIHH